MRRALALLGTLLVLAAAGAGQAGAAPAPRASLPTIERQVMCVTCKIPLDVAESPQAERERAFIAGLISRGEDEAQIKRALVSQYGRSVLALPSAHGFGVFAYAVPVAVLAGLIALLVVLLPRWRAARSAPDPQPAAPALSSDDAARLEADMARFE
jgi:cytochrome c-type biogenesis protein CcmH